MAQLQIYKVSPQARKLVVLGDSRVLLLFPYIVRLAMQDSLMPLAQYMQHALGSQHVVTSLVQKAAEANLSSATKARKQEQKKLLEVWYS